MTLHLSLMKDELAKSKVNYNYTMQDFPSEEDSFNGITTSLGRPYRCRRRPVGLGRVRELVGTVTIVVADPFYRESS